MEEIKELESDEGMLLQIPSLPDFRLRGSIAAVCADTKGAHELGGFLSPSANTFCRLCLIDRKDIRHFSCFDKLIIRNKTNYDNAVLESAICKKKSRLTEILRFCLLNISKYFHIAENLILDAMHDFLESVVPFMIKLLLKELNSLPNSKISAELLNRRISLFHYSFNDLANKPSPKFTNEGIKKLGNYLTKQRAAQNWCLARMIPFLIGDFLAEDNKYYIHFLLLLDIMDLIFAPKIAKEHILVLEDLIRQFVDTFSELYPTVQPINKFHHMVHFPDIIRVHGPPVIYWCMRYEGYLNLVKQYAKSANNFVNFAKSAACNLQSIFCANLLDPDCFQKEKFVAGPSTTGPLTDFVPSSNVKSCISPDGLVSIAQWVTFNGWEYRPNAIVLLRHSFATESGLPEFAQIDKVFVHYGNHYFLLTLIETIEFDSHFHSFKVCLSDCEEKILIGLSDVIECDPLCIVETYQKDSAAYINVRHWV